MAVAVRANLRKLSVEPVKCLSSVSVNIFSSMYDSNWDNCSLRNTTTGKPYCNIISRRANFSYDSSNNYNFNASSRKFSINCKQRGSNLSRLGFSSHKWDVISPHQYHENIQSAVENGIRTIEAGQGEGSEQSLLDGLIALKKMGKKEEIAEAAIRTYETLSVLFRLGYRTISNNTTTTIGTTTEDKTYGKPDADPSSLLLSKIDGDFIVDKRQKSQLPTSKKINSDSNSEIVAHNISRDYIESYLLTSPLVQEYAKDNEGKKGKKIIPNLIGMIHNPEEQVRKVIENAEKEQGNNISEISYEKRQRIIQKYLVEAFTTMENAARDGKISSYGIVSNGLCLPPEHPLHLSWEHALFPALKKIQIHYDNNKNSANDGIHFSTIQLPINLLETSGIHIANNIQHHYTKLKNEREILLTNDNCKNIHNIDIIAMRPLTCYPDRGTGTGNPFQIIDYLLPSGTVIKTNSDNAQHMTPNNMNEKDSNSWTNTMVGPPISYLNALKKALRHFDAEDILQKLYGENDKERELSEDERETLEGCKLLSNMLHDLDANLENIRSYKAHEEDLYNRIIPLIYNTFAEYDSTTATILEEFFLFYSNAVKYNIAKNTRQLLSGSVNRESIINNGVNSNSAKKRNGIPSSSLPSGLSQEYIIPKEIRLQEYAIHHLLKQKVISKIMIGCSQSDQVLDNINIAKKSLTLDGTGVK